MFTAVLLEPVKERTEAKEQGGRKKGKAGMRKQGKKGERKLVNEEGKKTVRKEKEARKE